MRWLRLSGRIILGVGIVLLVVWGAAHVHRAVMRRSDLAAFEEARRAIQVQAEQPTDAVAERSLPEQLPVDFSLWSEARVRHYEESLAEDLGLPIAVLRIPEIELEVPVLAGTDELTLNRAVGWIPGTARPGEPGNLGIAGHRDGFFRGVKDLRLGHRIELETLTQKTIYVIDDLLIVDPEHTAVLAPTSTPTITLVTCYPFYHVGKAPRRYIVRATVAESSDVSAGFDASSTITTDSKAGL